MERQISVDPISVKEASMGRPSFSLMSDPPPLLPKFLSASLPSSASSSPRFATSLLFKKKSRNESPRQVHSQSPLGRSKSCGDGRASSAVYDEFDLPRIKSYSNMDKDNMYDDDDSWRRSAMVEEDKEKEFKCSSFCLFLPGLGKGKPVRGRNKEGSTADIDENVASRAVSMEKFECGSWASSADSINLYFDLPLELIQTEANDTSSPVTAAFVFDKHHVKGVLKNASTNPRKSHESARHVRFSASSPSSPTITPRLVKARQDFNAYLEAQSG